AAARAFVHEMDRDRIDLDAKVMKAVQLALPRAPVEPGPVVEQISQVLEVGALLPRRARRPRRPARVADAVAQVGEDFLRHGDVERRNHSVLFTPNTRSHKVSAPSPRMPGARTYGDR